MQRAEALKEIIHDRSMAMDTGELGAVKIACPVRRGVAGKGFHTRIPRRRPTLPAQVSTIIRNGEVRVMQRAEALMEIIPTLESRVR